MDCHWDHNRTNDCYCSRSSYVMDSSLYIILVFRRSHQPSRGAGDPRDSTQSGIRT